MSSIRNLSLPVVCAILVFIFGPAAVGQNATGVPPFSSTIGGPEEINLGNLNVHFALPALNKPGRGLSAVHSITYDSSVWMNGGTAWVPVSNWGWAGTSGPTIGYITYQTSSLKCFDNGPWYWGQRYNGWRYHDAAGTSHIFNISITSCVTDPGTGSATTTDGSGETMNVDMIGGTYAVHTTSGITINPPVQSPSGSGTIADTNGNQITIANGTTLTDTLGMTALTVAGSNPVSFSYYDTSGTQRSVNVNYSSYTIKTNFGCANMSEYGPTTVSLVSSISFPDGSSYNFSYEPTPGFAGDVTGRVASIQLRTDGTISYTYTGGSNGIVCADGTTAGLNRATSDGTMQYSRSGSGSAWTTTVTDATSAQNQTAINFQSTGVNFYETKRTAYSGSVAGGSVLRTAYTCYNGAAADCSGTAMTLPIARRTVTTQLDSNQESKVDTFYNSTYQLATETMNTTSAQARPDRCCARR